MNSTTFFFLFFCIKTAYLWGRLVQVHDKKKKMGIFFCHRESKVPLGRGGNWKGVRMKGGKQKIYFIFIFLINSWSSVVASVCVATVCAISTFFFFSNRNVSHSIWKRGFL